MPLGDLLRSLTERTDAEITSLLDTARAAAAALRQNLDRRRAERSAGTVEEHTRRLQGELERAVAEAVRAERGAELQARARARDRVFAAARRRLPAAGAAPAYRASVPARLTAALAATGEEPVELRCAPDLQSILEPLVRGRAGLRIVADPAAGAGFLLRTADGRVEVDETLERRLGADADALSLVAVRALEPA